MKKIFLSLFILIASLAGSTVAVHAQVKTKEVSVKKNTTIRSIPPPPASQPAPAQQPVAKQELPASTPVYSLTSVRVKIRTGSDNKEFPSKVLVTLRPRSTPAWNWSPFAQLKLDNEMKINSDTEFGLEREAQLRGVANLDSFQTSGLVLEILYLPNFFADAWKIENVNVVLEFKDQHGNPHPTLGNKTIVFSNAYGFLNNEFRKMQCMTDNSFAPLTAVITK